MSDDKDFTPSTNSTDPKEIKDSLVDIAYCTETLTHLAVVTAALIEISEEQGVSLTPRVSEIMNKLEEEKLRGMERLLREIKKEGRSREEHSSSKNRPNNNWDWLLTHPGLVVRPYLNHHRRRLALPPL